MASAPQPAGMDLGTTGGDWLFKQGDMLLGPVPARVLVDKLYRGEIDGRTPVAPEGHDEFVPIETVEFFKLHAKKAQVKVKVDQDTQTMRVQAQRKRMTRVGGFVGLGVLLLGVGAYGAYWLAVNKPWRHDDAADLVMIEVDPPKIALAVPQEDGVAVDIPVGSPTKPGSTAPRHTSRAKHGSAPTPTPGPQGSAEPDGMSGGPTFDQEALREAANAKMGSLRSCIIAEAKAHPEQPGHLQFELHVSSGGKVSKVWLEAPYGEGSLHDCVTKTIASWTFPKYSGEEANVTLGSSWKPIQH